MVYHIMDVNLQQNEEYNFSMLQIKYIKAFSDLQKYKYGCFILEPFYIGQGSTFGNIIRRLLLTDFKMYTITNIRVNTLNNDFKSISGLKEDYSLLSFNLKNILFKPRNLNFTLYNSKFIGSLYITGPSILFANLIKFDTTYFTLINPQVYIGTVSTHTDFYFEFDLINQSNLIFNNNLKILNSNIFQNTIDSLIVKRVSFKIKTIYDIMGKVRESLFLEIWTDGSILPQRCLLNILQKLTNISTTFSKIINKDINL